MIIAQQHVTVEHNDGHASCYVGTATKLKSIPINAQSASVREGYTFANNIQCDIATTSLETGSITKRANDHVRGFIYYAVDVSVTL
jgi:hypothetical protein